MTNIDRLDHLERLQRLRESGTLSEAEFAREKASLLADSSVARRSTSNTALFAVGIVAVLLVCAAAIGWAVWLRPVQIRTVAPSAALASSVPTPSRDYEFSPAEELSAAFRAATKHADTFTVTSDEGVVTTKPLRVLHLPFGPVLLTSHEIKDGCHACAGAIGVYYLDQHGASFVARKSWPDAVSGSGWGAAPSEWSLTQKFTSYPAIYASGGWSGQGLTCGSATLTELRPEGPIESDLITLSFSNEGAVDTDTGRSIDGQLARNLEGKIDGIVKDVSFDVQVSGASRFTEHYRRQGSKFVRTIKESRLSC